MLPDIAKGSLLSTSAPGWEPLLHTNVSDSEITHSLELEVEKKIREGYIKKVEFEPRLKGYASISQFCIVGRKFQVSEISYTKAQRWDSAWLICREDKEITKHRCFQSYNFKTASGKNAEVVGNVKITEGLGWHVSAMNFVL